MKNITILLHKYTDLNPPKERMEVSIKTINKIISSFKNFTTIEGYYSKKNAQSCICVCFDDGHVSIYDFYKTFFIPFTLYITVGSISTPSFLSWEQVEEMHKSKRVDVQNHGMNHFRYFKNHNITGIFLKNIPDIIDFTHFESRGGLPYSEYTGDFFVNRFIFNKPFLSEFQKTALEQLDKYGNITSKQIESILKKIRTNRGRYESKEERSKRIRENILFSRQIIQEKIGKKVNHFAWPYGDFSTEGVNFVKQAGYISCGDIELGTNNHKTSPFYHRRISVEEWKLPVAMIKLKSSNTLKYCKRIVQGRKLIEC